MKQALLFLSVFLFFSCHSQVEKKSLDKDWKKNLLHEAIEARKLAYCPYSHYQVGAALLTEEGKIIRGTNVENASYGMTNCAERTAVFTAVASGHQKFQAIAVCTKTIGSPCGACRQVLNEFNPAMIVLLTNEDGTQVKETTLSELLPNAFGPKNLE